MDRPTACAITRVIADARRARPLQRTAAEGTPMAARKPRTGMTKPRDASRKRRIASKGQSDGTGKRRAGAPTKRDDATYATDEETGRNVATGSLDAQLQADMSLEDLEAELEKPSRHVGAHTPVL